MGIKVWRWIEGEPYKDHSMILLDAFERTAGKAIDLVEERNTAATDQEERQTMLKEQGAFAYASVGEALSANPPRGHGCHPHFYSLLERRGRE